MQKLARDLKKNIFIFNLVKKYIRKSMINCINNKEWSIENYILSILLFTTCLLIYLLIILLI